MDKAIFAEVNAHLKSQRVKLSTGTIVDASIINAPSSTKNRDKKRDPEMHQAKKNNQRFLGMKAHIGVDSRSKLIHSVVASAANVHDSQALPYLLHGKERRVWGDSAYRGQREVIRKHARHARDFTQEKATRNHPLNARQRSCNHTKSSVRAKVEHLLSGHQTHLRLQQARYRAASIASDLRAGELVRRQKSFVEACNMKTSACQAYSAARNGIQMLCLTTASSL